MKYVQETYARDIYTALTEEVMPFLQGIALSIEGQGVHWRCTAKRNDRFCSIDCFSGPQYLIHFDHQSQTVATGRTSAKQQLISAVSNWLQGHILNDLYIQFEFVDKTKRALEAIEADLTRVCSELWQCAPKLYHGWDDSYELRFRAKDRACRLFYYSESVVPTTTFAWDECLLFQVETEDFERLAQILKRWLYDYFMPSDLQKEFAWIDIGELAQYYEEGRGIEGEFVMSWYSLERFYSGINLSCKPQILQLIAQARQRGYDRTLRAGQSLDSMIVSRSRRHGLRSDQPYLIFNFDENSMDVIIHFDEARKISFSNIELTPQLDALLKQLEAKDIN